MADFCHDWEPGGLGCCWCKGKCPSDCVGDFTSSARRQAKTLKKGYEIQLPGLCEGHGTYVFLTRDDDGTFNYVEISIETKKEVIRRK